MLRSRQWSRSGEQASRVGRSRTFHSLSVSGLGLDWDLAAAVASRRPCAPPANCWSCSERDRPVHGERTVGRSGKSDRAGVWPTAELHGLIGHSALKSRRRMRGKHAARALHGGKRHAGRPMHEAPWDIGQCGD